MTVNLGELHALLTQGVQWRAIKTVKLFSFYSIAGFCIVIFQVAMTESK